MVSTGVRRTLTEHSEFCEGLAPGCGNLPTFGERLAGVHARFRLFGRGLAEDLIRFHSTLDASLSDPQLRRLCQG